MPETKTELIVVDECPDTNGHLTIRWADGSDNGDLERQPIATVYDMDDAQAIVDAWNACQYNALNSDYNEAVRKDEEEFRHNVDEFLQILKAHKEQYAGSRAQQGLAEKLCELEGELKRHLQEWAS
jgi:hypothetical protein